MRSTLSAVGVLLSIGVVLAGGDYFLKERTRNVAAEDTSINEPVVNGSSSSASSTPVIIKKGNTTQKKSGANVESVFQQLALVPENTSEKSLIGLSAAGLAEAKTMVLLKNNDRAFLFSMIEGGSVKKILSALKLALQEEFSADLKDLVDETRMSENGPPVDVLSFTDPKISPEPLLFLRVRDRLYELHVAENGQPLLDQLVKELSR